MNCIYRSIWNDKTGTFVAVPEIANNAGKQSSSGAAVVAGGHRFVLKALAVSLMMTFGANVYALPLGGAVAAGGASISSGAGSMTITQATQSAAINWQRFNIAPGEAVRFVQPDSHSVALNRVLSADPSNILGSLSANGKVFLVNPNGILFGKGAQVNVGGLVASTLNITDGDFMAGRYAFSGAGTGTILNQGSINANGGFVALLGASISNEGVIAANLGTVALAAGNAITLDLAGDGLLNVAVNQGAVSTLIQNGGLIQADGGQVLLTAQAAGALLQSAVNNTGVIQAQTVENHNGTIRLLGDMQNGTVNVGGSLDVSGVGAGQTGGTIKVLGQTVNVAGANINASGDAGGGLVLVGGNFHGAGPEQNSQRTSLDSSVMINADAIQSGNGGQIAVWSDGGTSVGGTLTARGGVNSGDGGFIETSGNHLTIADNTLVNTLAGNGKSGTWLLDPKDFTVQAGSDIAGVTLSGNLVTSNVTILSSNGTTGTNGDINVNEAVTWTAATTLTLNAVHNVNVNAAITATNGSLVSNAGTDVNLSGAVTTTSGSITSNATAGNVNVNAAMTTTDGNFTANAGRNINVNGAAMTTTRGNVDLRAANDGTGVGTVVFAAAPPYALTGPNAAATIYYTPSNYATPTDYSGNFTLTGGATLTTKMWVFAQGVNKVYDATPAATLAFMGTPTASGKIVTLIPGTANFADKNVATGKTITFSGYTIGGANAADFALFAGAGTTTANITQRPLTVSATGIDRVYNGTTADTVTLADNRIAGDVLTLSDAAANFLNRNVGNGKVVNVTGINVAGADAANYSFNTVAATTANITPALLDINAVTDSRVYNGTTSSVGTPTSTGLQSVDTLSGLSQAYASRNVMGTNGSLLVVNAGYTLTDGNGGNNYTVSLHTAPGTITPALLTGSITVANKTYDSTTAATITSHTLVGVLGADLVSYSGGTANFDTPNPGTGKTVTGTGLGIAGADAGNYTVNSIATTTAAITPLTDVEPPFTASAIVVPPFTAPAMVVPPAVLVADGLLTASTAGVPTEMLSVVPAAMPDQAPAVLVETPAVVQDTATVIEPIIVPAETPLKVYVAPHRLRKQDRN